MPTPPKPAVIAVARTRDAVLLVRRANPPDAGLWGFPGGHINPGEPLVAAALRELTEETGLTATSGDILTALDVIDHGPDGSLRFHYVLIAVQCHGVTGTPKAADDALDARWIALADLETLEQSRDVTRIAQLARPDH